MIAKLITHGSTRAEAIQLMQHALRDYRIVGLNNNLRFLKRVFDNPVFQNGDYDTGFIEQNIKTLLYRPETVDTFLLVAALAGRGAHHALKLPLPRPLLAFRNVPQPKRLSVTLHDTALSKDLKW
jgi:acetyl/propionyl-CoA carboxylase alpha subunit